MTDAPLTERSGILGRIRNPLVFFALALLVIEGIFGLVVSVSEMSPNQQFASLLLMMLLFVLVVGLVALVTIKWPANLYEQVAEHLVASRAIEDFVTGPAFRDAVEDVVVSLLRPDALREVRA